MKQNLTPLILFCLLCAHLSASGASAIQTGWSSSPTPFRVIEVAANQSSIWVCGVDEGIASSSDGGAHWQVKHLTQDGNLLLNIRFVSNKFGYAAGTGGLILMTEDGGESWTPLLGVNMTILQLSFSDPQHGLIRTPDALRFTTDGGRTWSAITPSEDANLLKAFPYTYSLVAIDSDRMAVMLKQGAAQYEPQSFLVTGDGGKSWKVVNIPSVTLYSFLAVNGKYWAVGTEVVGKDKPGGGHGVPVALYSTDGVTWTHASNDLSACQLEMCVACTPQGCFSSNGTITDFFGQGTTFFTFPTEARLTAKWALADSSMCFVGSEVSCTAVKSSEKATKGDSPVPVKLAPGPLGVAVAPGPHCISCEMDRMLVDPKVQGAFVIKLSLDVARDGTVKTAMADGALSPSIKSRIEQQTSQWLFEPYTNDGVRVNLKLTTRVQVNVVRSR